MDLRDKKAWLQKHGYVKFEFNDKGCGVYTIQWIIFGKAFLYTGRGEDEQKAFHNLYYVVKETLYGIINSGGNRY